MKTLIEKTKHKFQTIFGYEATNLVQAPGRVNLIGEHTDYNDGFVLPCAINYGTVIAFSKRTDNQVRVIAADYDDQMDQFSIHSEIKWNDQYLWSNYVRGIFKFIQAQYVLSSGVDLVISGNVPQGAGLSSSASLEVAVGTMLKHLFQLPLSATQIALIGQEAENKFVGCNCGIMDQLISAKAAQNAALLIDCRSLEGTLISVPKELSIMIINSKIQRGLVESEYNLRREQCEYAAKILKVKALRDATLEQLLAHKDEMDPIVFKRAHHVITENDRTLKAAEALQTEDYALLSTLMAQSHESMKNDFEITVPGIDYLVETVQHLIQKQGGVRMTGGGFGGCVVALLPSNLVENVKRKLIEQYKAQFGLDVEIYVCQACDGASELSI